MPAHFEVYVSDIDKGKAFYGGLFGWSFSAMPGGEDEAYHLAEGEDFGEGTALTVGMLRRPDAKPAPGSPIRGGTMTFEVADVDERYAWALANGGAEALPPTDMAGIGRFAYVEDGEGNVVGMIRPENA